MICNFSKSIIALKCNNCKQTKATTVSDRKWTKVLEKEFIRIHTGNENDQNFSHFCSDLMDIGADVPCDDGLCIETRIFVNYGMFTEYITVI